MFNKDFKTGFHSVVGREILTSWDMKNHPRPEWREQELVLWKEFNNRSKSIEAKLNLVLSHLSLEYVPETEKKEPAKLVEKQSSFKDCLFVVQNADMLYKTDDKPKKKRGRPKKK